MAIQKLNHDHLRTAEDLFVNLNDPESGLLLITDTNFEEHRRVNMDINNRDKVVAVIVDYALQFGYQNEAFEMIDHLRYIATRSHALITMGNVKRAANN